MNRNEGGGRSFLVDPRGKPLSTEPSIVLSHEIPAVPVMEHGIVVPDIAESIPSEFREARFAPIAGGALYFPAETMAKRIDIETDVHNAPEDLREEDGLDYLGFSTEEIETAIDAHKKLSKNLFSGIPEQRGVYLARFLEALGFLQENHATGNVVTFSRGIAEAIAQERSGRQDESAKFAREGFVGSYLAKYQPLHHSAPNMDQGKRIYEQEDDAPYQKLALLFIPEVWLDLQVDERRWLVDSILSLYEATDNPEDIFSPELFLRLTEILKNESDVGVRSLSYLLFDMVPYASLPREVKRSLVETIAKHKEFRTPIVSSLLMDPEGIHQKDGFLKVFRDSYLVFREDVVRRASGDLSALAAMPAKEWVRLVQDIERLNLLTITNDERQKERLSAEAFGIELEIIPYSHAFDAQNDRYYLADVAVQALKKHETKHGLSSASVDQGCVEVRTGGANPISAETLVDIHDSAITAERSIHGGIATFHLHVDWTPQRSEFGRIFADSKNNHPVPNAHTLELRSFRPPTLVLDEGGKRVTRAHRVDIVGLERTVLFSALSDPALMSALYPESRVPIVDVEGLSASEAVKKILAVQLSVEDPLQRIAAIQLMHRPPLFLEHGFMASLLAKTVPKERKEELLIAGEGLLYHKYRSLYRLSAFDERGRPVRSDKEFLIDMETSEELDDQVNIRRCEGLLQTLTTDGSRGYLSDVDKTRLMFVLFSMGRERAWAPAIAAVLPLVPPTFFSRALQIVCEQINDVTPYIMSWAERSDMYDAFRERISPEDRSYWYHQLMKCAKNNASFNSSVLRRYHQDASREDACRAALIYGGEALFSAEELETVLINEFKSSSEDSFMHPEGKIAALLILFSMDGVDHEAFVVRWLSNHLLDPRQEEEFVKRVLYTAPELIERILDGTISLADPTRSLEHIWDYYLDVMAHQRGDRGWKFLFKAYSHMDFVHKYQLYDGFIQRSYAFGSGHGIQISSLDQRSLLECLERETDPDIKTYGLSRVISSGYFSEYPDEWIDQVKKSFPSLGQEARVRLLVSLIHTGDVRSLDVVRAYFPYGLSWEKDAYLSIMHHLMTGLPKEGRRFLYEIYENNPTPLVRRCIEKTVPNVVRLFHRKMQDMHTDL